MASSDGSFSCRSLFWLAVLLVVSACAGAGSTPTVDPGVAVAAEQRILSPFRAEQTIASDRLEMVMSANFRVHLISPSYDVERKPQADGGAEYLYRSRSSDALRFEIANTRFLVTKRARVVVLGGSVQYQLSATASGDVMVTRKGAERGALRSEVTIQNGVFRAK